MSKKIHRMPIDTEFSYWLYKNHLEEWNKLHELSKEYETEQCNIANVVGQSEQFTPKQLYILAQKHSIQDFQKILKEAPSWKG